MKISLKKKSVATILVLWVLAFQGCQEVIEVDLPSEEPRLIIDAIVRVDESAPFVNISVRVALTSPFFGEIPVTNLKQITVINTTKPLDNLAVLLETEPNSGVYEKTKGQDFFKEDDVFVFQVDFEDQLFLAETKYVRTPAIDTIRVGDGKLFSEKETEVIVSFTDEPDVVNNYIFDLGFGEFFTTEDEFYPGQSFEFSYFYDENLPKGELEISILGADRDFYDYMTLLTEQSKDDISPFDTPAATVRGNIINVTDIDNITSFDNVDQANNFALGYFAVVQTHKKTFIIE